MTTNSNTIDILGYFDRGNSGDEAFKDAHRVILGKSDLNFRSTLTGETDAPPEAMPTAILGGGDVVAPFFLDKIPLGRRFVMYSVGLKYEQSSIAAMIERRNDIVYTFFRNKIDVELCRNAGIFNCGYAPDMVFALMNSFRKPPVKEIIPELPSQSDFIIVSLADHFNYSYSNRDLSQTISLEHRKQELACALDLIAEDSNIAFFPLSCYRNHMDNRFHYDVWKLMKQKRRAFFLRKNIPPLDAIGFFSIAKAVISMKLHGNIYGLVCSTPTVNIGVGRKQRLLFEEAGLEEQFVSAESFTATNIVTALTAALTQKAKMRATALKSDYYNQVISTQKQLLSFLV